MPQTTVTLTIDATYVLKVIKQLKEDLSRLRIDEKPFDEAIEAYSSISKACRYGFFVADPAVARMVKSFQVYELSKLKEESNNETL